MKYADVVESIMRKLLIARDADVGELLAARGYYRMENLSARNNARKILKHLTELGRLEGGEDWFRVPGCKSLHKEHSRHLTKALVKILKVFPDSHITREKAIPAVNILPDSIVELVDGNKRQICILEVINNEFSEFTEQKRDIWLHWPGAIPYLSELVGYRVPHFELVAYPESPVKEFWNFADFMKEATTV